eukprot:g8480.t1
MARSLGGVSVSAVQPVIVEEVTHVELRPLSVQETIREEGKFSELHCPQNEGATAGVDSYIAIAEKIIGQDEFG